jgi:hypothetical protein
MIGTYSLLNLMKEYKDNKPIIDAYISGSSIEGMHDDMRFLGLTVGVFVTMFIISLLVWIWAIVVTMKYWKQLPSWAQILAVIGLLSGIGGPLMTLVVVYIGKESGISKKISAKSSRR